MFGLIKPTLLGSLVMSTMSAFAEGFEQGRNQVAAPVSEVTATSSSQTTEFTPVDKSRIASWAYEEASFEAAGFLPGSTTLMESATASDLSACSTSASPACGIEVVTPVVTAFDISSSSAQEIIVGIDVSSSTFPEFDGFPPIPTHVSAFSDEDIESYQPEYTPPTTKAHEQYIKDSEAGTYANPQWAAVLWLEDAAEDKEMRARWHVDRGIEYAQAAEAYKEATESVYDRLRRSEARSEQLKSQNTWLFTNEHQVCFNNPATLKHDVPINIGSHHLCTTVLTRSIFAIVVGIAVLYILSYVFIVARMIIKKGRSVFEQVRADCGKFLGILTSLTSQCQGLEPRSASTSSGPAANQQAASPKVEAAVDDNATQHQQCLALPISEAVDTPPKQQEQSPISEGAVGNLPTKQQEVVLQTTEAFDVPAKQKQAQSPVTEAFAAMPEAQQQVTRAPLSKAVVALPKSAEKKTSSPTSEASSMLGPESEKRVISASQSEATLPIPAAQQEKATTLPTSEVVDAPPESPEKKTGSPLLEASVTEAVVEQHVFPSTAEVLCVVEAASEKEVISAPKSEAAPAVPSSQQQDEKTVPPTSEAVVVRSSAQQVEASLPASEAPVRLEKEAGKEENGSNQDGGALQVGKVVSSAETPSFSMPARTTYGAERESVVESAPVQEERREENVVEVEPIIASLVSDFQRLKVRTKRAASTIAPRYKSKEILVARQYAKKIVVISPPRRRKNGSHATACTTSTISTSAYNLGSDVMPMDVNNPASAQAFQATAAEQLAADSLLSLAAQRAPVVGIPAATLSTVDVGHQAAVRPMRPQVENITQPAPAVISAMPQTNLPASTISHQVQQLIQAGGVMQVDGLINQPLAPPSLQDSARHYAGQRASTIAASPSVTSETALAMDVQIEAPAPVEQDMRLGAADILAEEEAMNLEGAATNMNIMAAASERGRQHTQRAMQEATPATTPTPPSRSSNGPLPLAIVPRAPRPQIRPAAAVLATASAPVGRPLTNNAPPHRAIGQASPRPQMGPRQHIPSVGPSGMKTRPSTRPAVAPLSANRPPISNGAPERVLVVPPPRGPFLPFKPSSAPSAAHQRMQPPAAPSTPIVVSKPMVLNGTSMRAIVSAQPRSTGSPQVQAPPAGNAPVSKDRSPATFSEEEEAMNQEGGAVGIKSMAVQAEEARQKAKQDLENAALVLDAPARGANTSGDNVYVRPPMQMLPPEELAQVIAPAPVTAPVPAPARDWDWSQVEPRFRPDYMDQPLAPPPPARPTFTLPVEQHSPVIDPALNMPEPAPWTAPPPLVPTPVAPAPTAYPAAQTITARPVVGNRGQEVVNINDWSSRLAEDRALTADTVRIEEARRADELRALFDIETDSEDETPTPAPPPAPPAPRAPRDLTSTTLQRTQKDLGYSHGFKKISNRLDFKPSKPVSKPSRPKSPEQLPEQDVAQQASGNDDSDDDGRKSVIE